MSVLIHLPANYLAIMYLTNPMTETFMIGGLTYTRAQILAQYNAVADESENNSQIVGLAAIPGFVKSEIFVREDVAAKKDPLHIGHPN